MIKIKSKLIAIALSLLVLLSLTACGNSCFKVSTTAVFPDGIATLSEEETASLSVECYLSAAEETLTITGEKAIALYEAFDYAGCLQIIPGEDFQICLSEQAYIDLTFYNQDNVRNPYDAYVTYSCYVLYEDDIVCFPTFSSGKYGPPEGSFAALSAILTA